MQRELVGRSEAEERIGWVLVEAASSAEWMSVEQRREERGEEE